MAPIIPRPKNKIRKIITGAYFDFLPKRLDDPKELASIIVLTIKTPNINRFKIAIVNLPTPIWLIPFAILENISDMFNPGATAIFNIRKFKNADIAIKIPNKT